MEVLFDIIGLFVVSYSLFWSRGVKYKWMGQILGLFVITFMLWSPTPTGIFFVFVGVAFMNSLLYLWSLDSYFIIFTFFGLVFSVGNINFHISYTIWISQRHSWKATGSLFTPSLWDYSYSLYGFTQLWSRLGICHGKTTMSVLPKHFIYLADALMRIYGSLFWCHEWFVYIFIFAGLYVRHIDHIIWLSWCCSKLTIMEYIYVYLHASWSDAGNQPYRTNRCRPYCWFEHYG